jgi:hypothetical protein
MVARRRTKVYQDGVPRWQTSNEVKNLRVLLIGFSPVIRAGLQAILAKDQGIEEEAGGPACALVQGSSRVDSPQMCPSQRKTDTSDF